MSSAKLVVVLRREEESWSAFVRRIREAEGEVIVVLSPLDATLLKPEEDRTFFLAECARIRYRVKLAVKDASILSAARALGIRVLDHTSRLRNVLHHHPSAREAIGHFSPHLWRQEWRTRLQGMGILSLPRLRIWCLSLFSLSLFLFVMLRLLPSAEVRVWPRQDSVSQTTNILLAQSGARSEDVSPHIRSIPLLPVTVTVKRSITFDRISKEFVGKGAEVRLTIVNQSREPYGLRKGTRLVNQAGMVFRLDSPVVVPAAGSGTVLAKAEDQDIYGQDIGGRGNVPPGLHWNIPGLSPEEQRLVYGFNAVSASGGRTASRMVLQMKDIEGSSGARRQLESELLAVARQLIEEEREIRNAADEGVELEFLNREELVKKTFSGFVLPLQFIGQPVSSVPVEGSLLYTVYAYDARRILAMLSKDLQSHVVEGRRLLPDSLNAAHLKVYVIAYADDFSWIKLTADLTGTEQFILDPFTPAGARFARKVREQIAGLTTLEALRIIRNMPEADKVEISVWPPWSRSISTIPSHIAIRPM